MLSRRALLTGAGAVAVAAAVPLAHRYASGGYFHPTPPTYQFTGMRVVKLVWRLWHDNEPANCYVELANERGQQYSFTSDNIKEMNWLTDVMKERKTLTIEMTGPRGLDIFKERTRVTGEWDDGDSEG